VFTRTVSNNGNEFPYGLGWFIQYIRGQECIWHSGHSPPFSALIIKIPEKELAFTILANQETINGFTSITDGDLTESGIALEFLNAFVFGEGVLPDVPIE